MRVSVKGRMMEVGGETRVVDVTSVVVHADLGVAAVVPADVTTEAISANVGECERERWEGCLVRAAGAEILADPDAGGAMILDDGTGPRCSTTASSAAAAPCSASSGPSVAADDARPRLRRRANARAPRGGLRGAAPRRRAAALALAGVVVGALLAGLAYWQYARHRRPQHARVFSESIGGCLDALCCCLGRRDDAADGPITTGTASRRGENELV
ncbi:hypothetical protein SO694_00041159 [Aureococcus anophagefferens]|uniref:Uncharacterized protein n=1 Tax=Aureococcus anophagefferens TaxID=44056 RepID=A0ABR1G721_AURAN